MNAIGQNVDMVDLYYELGVRWMLTAYNKNNMAGGGCMDDDGGLTNLGKHIIKRMNKVGMVICCAHTGPKTITDIASITDSPFIFSHANSKSVFPHPRNISDEMIKLCAEHNGVIGINGIGCFLGENDASISRLVQHIDHIANLVGPEYIGLALDYTFDQEEVAQFVQSHRDIFPEKDFASTINMMSIDKYPEITLALLKHGFNENEVKGILGKNWLKVAQKIWK